MHSLISVSLVIGDAIKIIDLKLDLIELTL